MNELPEDITNFDENDRGKVNTFMQMIPDLMKNAFHQSGMNEIMDGKYGLAVKGSAHEDGIFIHVYKILREPQTLSEPKIDNENINLSNVIDYFSEKEMRKNSKGKERW
jgi:hypothetical protein